ncbi:MAG: nuclease A inhibitor family protein [Pyrinomonadaceae bacterium]
MADRDKKLAQNTRKNINNFSDEKKGTNESFFRELKRACSGLVYISETDAEIVPFRLIETRSSIVDTLREDASIDLTGTEPVDESNFDEFFDRLTLERDWHGDEERRSTMKFGRVRDLLSKNLSDLKVFRFGRVRIDIFVVGSDKKGKLVGIKTRAVET